MRGIGRATEFAAGSAPGDDAHAFNRAADLYQHAVADAPDAVTARQWRIALGDALAHAGRGAEAARAYLAAVDGASVGERLQLQQRAMGQFMRTGRFDEGLATLREILPAIQLKWPVSARRALWSLIVGRIRLRWRGLSFEEPQVPPEDDALLRIDACWSVATGLSVLDPLRATLFQTHLLLRALDAGDRARHSHMVWKRSSREHWRNGRGQISCLRRLASWRSASARRKCRRRGPRGVAHHLHGEFKRRRHLDRRGRLLIEQRSKSGKAR